MRLNMAVQSLAWSWRFSVNRSLSFSAVWDGALLKTSWSSVFGLPSMSPGWMRFTIRSPRTTADSVLRR